MSRLDPSIQTLDASSFPVPLLPLSTARRPFSSLTYPMLEEEEEEEGAAGGEKMPEYTEEDRRHMRRALELAAKGLGR